MISVNKKINCFFVFWFCGYVVICILHFLPFKVCDFGLARERSYNLEGGKFPIKWTAPEALRHSVSNYSDTLFF